MESPISNKNFEKTVHVPGFEILSGWSIKSPKVNVDVRCDFISKDKFYATVAGAEEEDIDKNILLQFLKNEGVIRKNEEWIFEEIKNHTPPVYLFTKFYW